MSRFGKCQNLAGCLLAYRGEEIEVQKGQPFICAECGKPLAEVKPPSTMWLRYLYGLLIAAVLGGAALFVFPKSRGIIEKRKHEKGEVAPAPKDAETPQPNSSPDTPAASSSTETVPAPSSEAPPVFTAPKKLDLDVTKGENKDVKNEVLTRIDLMPNVSQGNKDRLYQSVERARSMGKVLTISFEFGRSELSPSDIQSLKAELEKPEVLQLRGDPTAVFVVLGYADSKGDPKKIMATSQKRADAVLKAMKEKCGVANVLHPVAMGSSKVLDAQNMEKNRIVEIWAVLP